MFGMLSVLAELQRELIVANTRDGLAAARARGRNGGRRPRPSADQIALAQRLYDAGEHTVQQIADIFSVPRTTVYGHLDNATKGNAQARNGRRRCRRPRRRAESSPDQRGWRLVTAFLPAPRYVRRRFLSAELARALAIEIANATFDVRDTRIWGQASTTVASDSKHVGAVDQNLLTEWHARYRKPGVLIYWHVETKAMAIHSQLISCSASEVAAMIEGAMRHGTTFDVEGNYTDSHGQSQIGLGITRLLDFELRPRIKQINKAKLYQDERGDRGRYPALVPALTRPIRWPQIAAQYDQMVSTRPRSGPAPPAPKRSFDGSCKRTRSTRPTRR